MDTTSFDSSAGAAARWHSVERRDPAAEGKFWYAVATTGVYCRPTCPARLPRRENVAFYASRAEAERAGFRPCKRCKPDQPSARERLAQAVARACALIDVREDPPALGELASAVGFSAHYFHRVFRALTGITPREYAQARRSQRFKRSLAAGDSVTQAIYDAGYASSSRFYERSHAVLGMTPSAYRRAGAGETIRYAVVPSSLGLVLVAATPRGICCIEFGERAQALLREVRQRFSGAEFAPADAEFKRWVERVLACIEQPRRSFDLPLDIVGSAFQQRVWRALRDIRAGATATYTEVAQRIGQPRAARAVASACAANPVAVAVPCHRVLGAGGKLSGYRWGAARKRELLQRESDAPGAHAKTPSG